MRVVCCCLLVSYSGWGGWERERERGSEMVRERKRDVICLCPSLIREIYFICGGSITRCFEKEREGEGRGGGGGERMRWEEEKREREEERENGGTRKRRNAVPNRQKKI